ncbi:hypothetical protein BGZ99_006869 [Dissophora globulifera]|uniref:RGS domain-containing protein n=1 Tax=Dissophora globulifera TaxID=979702 RepID=A0A9P6RFG1_9FUNG|nr:hypothetical protein BGZ99_006869 [Dissophora globulifera]
MDGAGFQGMPRFPLTPAEEALVPRPHSSASQVAPALPAAYTRRGSTQMSSSPPRGQQQQHRPQYSRTHPQNHPYLSSPGQSQSQSHSQSHGSRIFSFSFSSSSVSNRPQQPSSSPSPPPASPSTPSNNAASNTIQHSNLNSNDLDEQEYPQNPQDSYHPYSSQLHSPIPMRPSSPIPVPRHSFSLTPRPAEAPSPQLYNELYENTPYQNQSGTSAPYRGSLDSYHRRVSPQLLQDTQDSWPSSYSIRMESPEPMSDSEDGSHSGAKGAEDLDKQQPRRSRSNGIFNHLPRYSKTSPNATDERMRDDRSQVRTSLESGPATRFSHDSQYPEAMARLSRSRSNLRLQQLQQQQQDVSDEERHQEARRSKPTWRPSLSLIRQESSNFNVLSLPDQHRRYPQNDQRRISDNRERDGVLPRKRSKKGQRKKKRRLSKQGQSRQQPLSPETGSQHRGIRLPDLMEVLEKRTRYPLGYDDFEAFLRSQRAAEYLNFWADVNAHEQLYRTFEISERRLKREQQLEERAMARDRRRLVLSGDMDRFSPEPDTSTPFGHGQPRNHGATPRPSIGQELNSSNVYIASRSSLQLPLNDHLSFPPETRRYGTQSSSVSFQPIPASLSQRRGSEQRTPSGAAAPGAYNRLLAGGAVGRRSSLENSRHSLNEVIPEDDNDSTDVPSNLAAGGHGRGSIDIIGNSRLVGRRPSTTVDYFGNGVRRSPSQQLSSQPLHDQSVQDEMAQLVEAVDNLLLQPNSNVSNTGLSQQSLQIVEPSLNRKPSAIRPDGSVGPLQPPLTIRRSGDSANIPGVYTTIQDGRSAALQIHSYRTISREDLEESALRIYHKYLIQLRTASMAAEEQSAAASKTSADPGIALGRGSMEKAIAPGWDGYAEQVIIEWNEKWRGRSAEARRSRRLSEKRSMHLKDSSNAGTQDSKSAAEKDGSHSSDDRVESKDAENMESGEKRESSSEGDTAARDQDNAIRPSGPQRMKVKRTETATGITAFLTRLLRTETTVVELPTLTINTTTVVEDAEETDESDYQDDDDYDSDIGEDEDEDEDEYRERDSEEPSRQSKFRALVPGQDGDLPYADNTVEGSLSGDAAVSEYGTIGSAIQLQTLISGHPAPSSTISQERTHLAERSGSVAPPLILQRTQEPSSISNPTTGIITLQSTPAPSDVASTAAQQPQVPLLPTSAGGLVGHSRSAAAFYLPLECRQRIHTQIQQEGRTDGAHVFGPAKGFVIDVVLRDHYYPLFLRHVRKQNLGLLHQNHVNNRIKQRGAIALGALLWTVLVAVQVTLVMMDWGGWRRPWVWVVNVVAGWPGAMLLATGVSGFSPLYGLLGKIAEDRHVFRLRRIIEPSIRLRHSRTAFLTLLHCLFWTLIVAVAFAAIPQRRTGKP